MYKPDLTSGDIFVYPLGNRTISRDQLIEAEEDLNSALDEALETYDLAPSWMEGDGEKEVVRK